jgi:putative ABC transport system permease protein
VGKTIEADGEQYEISAVFFEVPKQSHLHFDVVFSMELLRMGFPTLDSIGPMVFYTYVKAPNSQVKTKLRQFLLEDQAKQIEKVKLESEKQKKELEGMEADIVFLPLKDIHLKSHAEKEYQTNGNYDYILIYLTIAIFILILASINYINLATASSVMRAREIGVRKVLGAQQRNIFMHFISEAFLLVLTSAITALVLVEMVFPTFNAFVGKELSINMLWNFEIIGIILLTILLITLFSGLYPSLLMSQFNPLKVLANRLNAQKKQPTQFVVATCFGGVAI